MDQREQRAEHTESDRPKQPIRSYRDLRVWNEAMVLAGCCYHLTRSFPREELFGLTAQIRRAAASVPANIGEGYGRSNAGDYARFLLISQGSLKELETHLILSQRVALMERKAFDVPLALADQVGRMLRSLHRSVRPP